MFGIKIQDSKKSRNGGNFLNFDLRDILTVIGEPTYKAKWRCRDLYYTAVRNGEFVGIREECLDFTGEEFVQFVSNIHQTIDGRFEVRREGAAKKSWLIILVVDSSWFEVWTSKQAIIEKLRNRFEKVSHITGSVA